MGDQWYVWREGEPIHGPLTTEGVVSGIASGKIPRTSVAKRASEEAWTSLADIPEFASVADPVRSSGAPNPWLVLGIGAVGLIGAVGGVIWSGARGSGNSESAPTASGEAPTPEPDVPKTVTSDWCARLGKRLLERFTAEGLAKYAGKRDPAFIKQVAAEGVNNEVYDCKQAVGKPTVGLWKCMWDASLDTYQDCQKLPEGEPPKAAPTPPPATQSVTVVVAAAKDVPLALPTNVSSDSSPIPSFTRIVDRRTYVSLDLPSGMKLVSDGGAGLTLTDGSASVRFTGGISPDKKAQDYAAENLAEHDKRGDNTTFKKDGGGWAVVSGYTDGGATIYYDKFVTYAGRYAAFWYTCPKAGPDCTDDIERVHKTLKIISP